MLRTLIYLSLIVLAGACAKPPHQELDAAEHMVKQAHSLRALEFAPTEYQAAHTALNDARMAMDAADYGDARDSLEFAVLHARRAIELARAGRARQTAEEARRAAEEEDARQKARQRERAQQEAERIAKQQRPAEKTTPPAPQPEPKVEPLTAYNVGEGETLWTISAQPEVYDEGLLWPLLYQANRDQIKDPRQIFPGQTLSIRRDMTEQEREEARRKARESDIFPIPDKLRQQP